MGKRKPHTVVHQQEQCDVWLSTEEKKEQTPAAKRQRLFRPISNIANLVLSSQPIKAGTKQTDIKNFFTSKSASIKENCIPTASSHTRDPPAAPLLLNEPRNVSPSRSQKSVKELLNHVPQKTYDEQESTCNRAKRRRSLSVTNSPNGSLYFSRSHSNRIISHTSEEISTKVTKEVDCKLAVSTRESHPDEQFKSPPNVSRVNEFSEDVTFTVGTQECLRVRRSITKENADCGLKENRRLTVSGSELDSGPGRINYNDKSVVRKLMTGASPVLSNLSENELSEDVNFTMGTQNCLKVKRSEANGDVFCGVKNDSDLLTEDSVCVDNHDSISHYNICGISCESEDSKDVTFTMGTQNCLKVKRSETNNPVVPGIKKGVKSLFLRDSDLVTGHGSILDVNDRLTRNSAMGSSAPVQFNSYDDNSEAITYTMGTQGCLKVKTPKTKELWTRSSDSELLFDPDPRNRTSANSNSQAVQFESSKNTGDDSEDITFTMGTQNCLKRKVAPSKHCVNHAPDRKESFGAVNLSAAAHQNHLTVSPDSTQKSKRLRKGSKTSELTSNDALENLLDTPQSTPSDTHSSATVLSVHHDPQETEDSEDVQFTLGTQGCWKKRQSMMSSNSSITPEDLQNSSPAVSLQSEQGPAFTIGSQGFTTTRHSSGIPESSDDSSEDVQFTVNSDGCLKVRGRQGQRSNIIPSQLSKESSQDVEFTADSQGCMKVRGYKGQRSPVKPTRLSQDSSDDIEFTEDSQGCMKVRGYKGQRSPVKPTRLSQDSSDDIEFTEDSQGCMKVRGYKGQRSTVKPTRLSQDSPDDIEFTEDSQDCLKVRKLEHQTPNVRPIAKKYIHDSCQSTTCNTFAEHFEESIEERRKKCLDECMDSESDIPCLDEDEDEFSQTQNW